MEKRREGGLVQGDHYSTILPSCPLLLLLALPNAGGALLLLGIRARSKVRPRHEAISYAAVAAAATLKRPTMLLVVLNDDPSTTSSPVSRGLSLA